MAEEDTELFSEVHMKETKLLSREFPWQLSAIQERKIKKGKWNCIKDLNTKTF